MEVKEIKRLLEAMAANNANELSLETADYKLSINRGQLAAAPAANIIAEPTVAQTQVAEVATEPIIESQPVDNGNYVDVNAPIVGTFYEAPAPDASSFVKLGDRVNPGTVLCIIEAMKLMNEIEAEVSGTISEIFVNNEDPVEYGQSLFRIKLD